MKKHLIQKTNLYTRNQIISGITGAFLFFGTILYLNLSGYAQTPLWLTKVQPVTAKPTIAPNPVSISNTQLVFPSGAVIIAQENVLTAYKISDGNKNTVATLSGQIHELGWLSHNKQYVITGHDSDSYDAIYIKQDQEFIETKLPSILNYPLKPFVTQDGRSIYFQSNIGSGKKVILKHDIATGLQQEIVESSLPIHKISLNSDGSVMALIVEMLNKDQVQTYILGIVQIGAKNLNLFPSVELASDTPLVFHEGSPVVFANSPDSILAFDVRSGKIVHTIKGSVLAQVTGERTLLTVSSKRSLPSCRKGLVQTTGYTQVSNYRFTGRIMENTDTDPQLKAEFNRADMVFADPVEFRTNPAGWVAKMIDPKDCREYLGIFVNTNKQLNTFHVNGLITGQFLYIP